MSDEYYPYAEEKNSFGWGYLIGAALIAVGLYAQLKGLNMLDDTVRMRTLWIAMGCMFSGSIVSFCSMMMRRRK